MRSTLSPTLRFAALPIAIVLVLIAGLYLVVAWRVSAVLEERTALRLDFRATALARSIESRLHADTSQLELLATMLRGKPLPPSPTIAAWLDTVRHLNPALQWLAYAGADGTVLASSGSVIPGQSLAAEPVFIQSRQHSFISQIHGLAAGEGCTVQPCSAAASRLDVGVPVRDAQLAVGGVITSSQNVDWITDLGKSTVAYPDGLALGLRWALVMPDGKTIPSAPPFLWDNTTGGTKAWRVHGSDGRDYLVQTRKVVIPQVATNNWWTVVLYQDLAIATAPGSDIKDALGITAILAAVLLVAFGYFMTRRNTRAFQRLYMAAERRFDQASSKSPHAVPFGDVIDQMSEELERDPRLDQIGPEALFIRRLVGDAQQFKRVIDHFPMGVCVTDAAFAVQYSNPTFEKMLGWDSDQIRGLRFDEFMTEGQDAQVFAHMRASLPDLSGEVSWRMDARRGDGSRLAVQVQSIPLLGGGNQYDGALVLIQDISAEMEHRTQAASASHQLSILGEAITGYAFMVLDEQGLFVEWSRGATLLTGWSRQEALGCSLQMLLSPGETPEPLLADLLGRAQQHGSASMEGRLRKADGGSFISGGALYYISPGTSQSQFALVLSDETSAQIEATAIAQSEARLMAVIESASDAVISTDIHGIVQLFNPAAERIFRVAAEEMLGHSLNRLLPPAALGAHRGHMVGFAQSNTTQRSMGSGKVEGVRSDGARLDLEASISRAQIGDQVMLTAILRDVTERSRVERALIANQTQLAALAQNLLTQERETTQRLAQALHDDLGQTLAAQRLIFDAGSKTPGRESELPSWVLRLDRLIDDANRQVRRVLADLRPPLLDELGLYAALDNELRTRKVTHEGLEFILQWRGIPEEQRIPSEVEYVFFTITREAVGNAIRHANPTAIRVELTGMEQALLLEVIDNGTGKDDLENVIAPGHLGMVGMRERALAIGARLSFVSSVENGSTVRLQWGKMS